MNDQSTSDISITVTNFPIRSFLFHIFYVLFSFLQFKRSLFVYIYIHFVVSFSPFKTTILLSFHCSSFFFYYWHWLLNKYRLVDLKMWERKKYNICVQLWVGEWKLYLKVAINSQFYTINMLCIILYRFCIR